MTAEETLRRIRQIVAGNADRAERAQALAEAVRRLGNHRWCGVPLWVGGLGLWRRLYAAIKVVREQARVAT